MSTKTVMISGITGQDGMLAASLCLHLGFDVIGLGRSKQFVNGLFLTENDVHYRCTNYSESEIFILVKEIRPNVILNFAGQSRTVASWSLVSDTLLSQAVIVGNFLAAIVAAGTDTYFLNACSSEILDNDVCGDKRVVGSNLSSPYAIAQRAGFDLVRAYRKKREIRAFNLVCYNHESVLRSSQFVIGKILTSAYNCAKSKGARLTLGNLNVSRDWGYAPEYVLIALTMARRSVSCDIVACTGNSASVIDMARAAFTYHNLALEDYLEVDADLCRTGEPDNIVGDPEDLNSVLDFQTKYSGKNLMNKLCSDYELSLAGTQWVDWKSLLLDVENDL
jgi:GDPmannose 4,6-dehydratase